MMKRNNNLKNDNIGAIGIGVAGASNERGRERLFGLLDNLMLSDKTVITNDVETVYDYIWQNKNGGMLVNVGTGVICIGKKDNVFVKVAGNGHEEGDVGSGYWIAKEALLELSYKDSNVDQDDYQSLLSCACSFYQVNDYQEILNEINSSMNFCMDCCCIIFKSLLYFINIFKYRSLSWLIFFFL